MATKMGIVRNPCVKSDGGSRPDAARIGGVGVQIVRDWVVRFNAKGPDGLLTGKAPGAPSILDGRQRQARHLEPYVVRGQVAAPGAK